MIAQHPRMEYCYAENRNAALYGTGATRFTSHPKQSGQGFYEVAISRAYYAMFYAASALLASKGIARSKHSGVVSAFGEHFVKTGIFESTYAKMLGQAFDSRLDSDYDIIFTPEQALVEAIQQDAQRFVQRAEQYLQQTGAL